MKMKKNVIEEQSINDNNHQKLKELFPHAVSVDEDGKYVIDPQKLQMSLDPSKAEIKEDGYGLNWVGKKEAYHNAFTKNYKVLKPLKDDSKNWDETDNILIKGDNLDALKILRHNYFESIKMIYIDPPYNTKNDGFVYNDTFTCSTEETLEALGYDKEYIDYIQNIHGAKTHSGWLSFMYPRLLLAKDLLSDNGVISIDDNEVAQLRLLCDEVFGEENFVAQLPTVMNLKGNNDEFGFAGTHEFTIVYAKYKDSLRLNEFSINEDELDDWSEDEIGYFKQGANLKSTGTNAPREKRPNLYFPVFIDSNDRIYVTDNNEPPQGSTGEFLTLYPLTNGQEMSWRWSKEKFKNEPHNIIISRNGTVGIYKKQRPSLGDMPSKKPKTLFYKPEYSSGNGTAEIKEMFDAKVFSNPKPLCLIRDFVEIGLNKNDLILDFFAGSGTTAHAVMNLNKEDDGNRKYICVQWAEETPEKSEARKAGYETIFDITKARIDKAGDKIVEGDITAQNLDIGFRIFDVVEDTKQKIYQKSLEEMSQEDLLAFTENKTIESNEEILYNLFVAEALPLSTKHQELLKDKLYLASNVAFILGDITSDELVEALKDKKECEYITVYSPNISNDKFTLELESNISKLGIKPDKLRFRG
jgi:adenine-specific DNA-methyltransferase